MEKESNDWMSYFNALSRKVEDLQKRIELIENKEKENQPRERRENGGFDFFTKVGDNIVLQFGKYKGKFVEEVPDAYLEWVKNTFVVDGDEKKLELVEVVKKEIESRVKSGKRVV